MGPTNSYRPPPPIERVQWNSSMDVDAICAELIEGLDAGSVGITLRPNESGERPSVFAFRATLYRGGEPVASLARRAVEVGAAAEDPDAKTYDIARVSSGGAWRNLTPVRPSIGRLMNRVADEIAIADNAATALEATASLLRRLDAGGREVTVAAVNSPTLTPPWNHSERVDLLSGSLVVTSVTNADVPFTEWTVTLEDADGTECARAVSRYPQSDPARLSAQLHTLRSAQARVAAAQLVREIVDL